MLGFKGGVTTTPDPDSAGRSDRYSALLGSMDEGFCVLERVGAPTGESADYRYIEANSSFATQSGVANVLGRTMREVVGAECERWLAIWDTVLSTGTPTRFEQEFIGMSRWLEIYAFPRQR